MGKETTSAHSTNRINRPQSAARNASNGVRAASRAKGDVRALDLMLRHFNADFLTQTLLDHDFTFDNLHLITESDLTKLRITNKGHRQSVLSAAKEVAKEQALPLEERARRQLERVNGAVTQSLGFVTRSRIEAAQRRDRLEAQNITKPAAASVAARHVATDDNIGHFSENTATIQTANEHARCAQIYLEHHRVDRAWPRPCSKLSQTLHLSGAGAPDAGKPLYTVIDAHTGSPKVVKAPCTHNQGYSSKFCRTCAEFVSQSMAGQWQDQAMQRVVIGDGEVEHVPVWKAFKESDNLAIEYAKKRNNRTIKVRGTVLDFDALQWGSKPVRRVDADVVPFPTLARVDIVRPRCALSAADGGTSDEMLRAEQEAALQIQALQRRLITDSEETRSRLVIEQGEMTHLKSVLENIAAIMDGFHRGLRVQLEDAEEAARAVIEGRDYEAALERLNQWEEESVRNVAIKKWSNDCNAIYAKQCGVIEVMEERRRAEVEEIEEAARANLAKLLSAFNAQIRALQLKKRKSTAKAIREIESGLRCVICRRRNCVFHHRPWMGHWRTHGGALDIHPTDPTINANLSVLMGAATEHEWLESKKTDRSEREVRKRSRVHRALQSTTCPLGDVSRISVGSIAASPERPSSAFAASRGLPDHSAVLTTPPPPRPSSAASVIRTASRVSKIEGRCSPANSARHDKPFFNACSNPSSHKSGADTVSRVTKMIPNREGRD